MPCLHLNAAALICATAAMLLTLAPLIAASEPVGDGFIRHGVPAPVSRSRGAAVVEDGRNRPHLAVWLQDHRGCYGLVMIDPDTGDSQFFELPFSVHRPIVDAPFAFLYSSGGYFYSLFANRFVQFSPRDGAYSHIADTDDLVAMAMTEGDDGLIWAATYPNAHVTSFDPATQQHTDYGPVNTENWPQYPRALATDDAGWVYVGIGFTRNHILALDPATGEVHPMVDEHERRGGNVNLWRGQDGRVYARMPEAENWLMMHKGRPRHLDDAPDVQKAHEISHHQGGLFGALPDGREIERLNVADGTMRIRDANGELRHVQFDYPSAGPWIYCLTLGPDNRIYGSTGHPLRLFAFDPPSDEFSNTPISGGHINAMVSLDDKLFGAIYTRGVLIEIDPGQGPRVRQLADAGNTLLRPHVLIAHSDRQHVIQAGTPGYGRTGGGMMVYNTRTGQATIFEHTDVIEHHSTKALAELPNGDIIGGTTTAPGTGGERRAEQAELYILDWPSMAVVHRQPLVPDTREVRELLVADDGLVHGLDASGRYFVFEPVTREFVHSEPLAQHYGPVTGGQAPRVWVRDEHGQIHVLFRDAIVRINPDTFEHEKLVDTPVPVNIGVVLHEQRLYFTSGSELWSYGLRHSD